MKTPLLICITIVLLACSKLDENTLQFKHTITVDQLERSYTIHLPSDYNSKKDIPLILFLHGGGGSAKQAIDDYDFSPLANKNGSAVVYPDGAESDGVFDLHYWNAGGCCAYSMNENIDDVHFISALIDEVLEKYPNISSRKIFATGMSNGAMMCYRLATELSDKIAAVAPVSGTDMFNGEAPARQVPILQIHSVLDEKVPIEGGIGIAGYYFASLDSTLTKWANNYHCQLPPEVLIDNDEYKRLNYIDTAGNIMIECYLTKDGGHSWPGSTKSRRRADEPSTVINANELILEFFELHEME